MPRCCSTPRSRTRRPRISSPRSTSSSRTCRSSSPATATTSTARPAHLAGHGLPLPAQAGLGRAHPQLRGRDAAPRTTAPASPRRQPPQHKPQLFGGTAEVPGAVAAVQARDRRRLGAPLVASQPAAVPVALSPGASPRGSPGTARSSRRRSRRAQPATTGDRPRMPGCRRCSTPRDSRCRRAG